MIKNESSTAGSLVVVVNQADLNVETIKILYAQAHTALIGVTATATGVAALFYNEVSTLFLLLWLLVVYSLSFVRYLSVKKFKRLSTEKIDAIYWGRLFAFFAFLSGLTWGVASVFLFTPEDIQLFNILTLIIIAMSVGSLAALSAHPPAFYFFIAPTMLPMAWRYLTIDEQNYLFFGLLLFVFTFALISIIRVNHRMLRDSILLRFKNTELIEQLTKEKEKAEKANTAKTKFLAAASHDIRQPLHAMGLFLGVLEDRIDKPDQKNIVHKIQQSSDALNDLLDLLLDISKLDAGIIKVERKSFPVSRLFEALSNEFQPYANEKKLRLSFADSQLWVDSDYKIIERIMRNLISNAIKYTHNGGVLIGCRRQNNQVKLMVYDTGIGISKSDVADIFNEFHQLYNPERDRSKGLGLGLSIVERMAKLLDAPLIFKSIPEQGSSFGVIIPSFLTPVENIDNSLVNVNPVFFDNKTVLIIDDEAVIRDSLAELLQSWHCDVLPAASGLEAASMLTKNKILPDIILADYRLRNNETGVDAIEKVHQAFVKRISDKVSTINTNSINVESSKIPAIIITGDTAPERIKQVENSGYKILHKPVSPAELRMLVADVLSSK